MKEIVKRQHVYENHVCYDYIEWDRDGKEDVDRENFVPSESADFKRVKSELLKGTLNRSNTDEFYKELNDDGYIVGLTNHFPEGLIRDSCFDDGYEYDDDDDDDDDSEVSYDYDYDDYDPAIHEAIIKRRVLNGERVETIVEDRYIALLAKQLLLQSVSSQGVNVFEMSNSSGKQASRAVYETGLDETRAILNLNPI